MPVELKLKCQFDENKMEIVDCIWAEEKQS